MGDISPAKVSKNAEHDTGEHGRGLTSMNTKRGRQQGDSLSETEQGCSGWRSQSGRIVSRARETENEPAEMNSTSVKGRRARKRVV